MRRDLVNPRRVALPRREVVKSIKHHRRTHRDGREPDPLYADLYEHVLRVSEWTESLRDMITTICGTDLSLQEARLNIVVKKKLTGWASIVAVPTDRDHRLLRPERALSGLRHARGIRGRQRRDGGADGHPLRAVPAP